MTRFAFDHPDDAIAALASPLNPVSHEKHCRHLLGRVLAGTIVSDRDSPAADVSAMDGYAVSQTVTGETNERVNELSRGGDIPVTAESVPGSPPPDFSPSGVIRIFTGAMIPAGCERVIQREHTIENTVSDSFPQDTLPQSLSPLGTIRWRDEARQTTTGANIRRRGENLAAGEPALLPGVVIAAPQFAAIANFGIDVAPVYRMVNVAIITTGDELGGLDERATDTLPPWKIRNSNAHALRSLFASRPYVAPPTMLHAPDDPDRLREILADAINAHDIVLLTGGVSMGDHDYVPQIVTQLGAKTVFHKLPLRPGKPILGAVYQHTLDHSAKPILGLPGNPVSATMGALRFAMPLVDKLAGISRWQPAPPVVTLADTGGKTLPLHWMRAVRLTAVGRAELVIGKGSGDLVSLAHSDGFIEMPPHANAPGPWPFYAW